MGTRNDQYVAERFLRTVKLPNQYLPGRSGRVPSEARYQKVAGILFGRAARQQVRPQAGKISFANSRGGYRAGNAGQLRAASAAYISRYWFGSGRRAPQFETGLQRGLGVWDESKHPRGADGKFR